jgi:hypothetical protein
MFGPSYRNSDAMSQGSTYLIEKNGFTRNGGADKVHRCLPTLGHVPEYGQSQAMILRAGRVFC